MSKTTRNKINRQKIDWLMSQPLDIQLDIATQHLEIIRIVLNSILEGLVSTYTGEKYKRNGSDQGRYQRWGFNPGSVKIGGQRIKVEVPRVHDKIKNKSQKLEGYDSIKNLPEQDISLMKQVLHGISTRDYKGVIDRLHDSFGDSAASVSRQFQERSKNALEEFESKRFDGKNFLALFIDGKYMASDQMVIVLGVTDQGQKIPLGIVQTSTENSISIGNLLRNLVDRGLKFEEGLLCVVDGAKGLKKAVKDVFSDAAIIQRCQWHKRENVVSYLSQDKKEIYRRRMQKAYNEDTYDEAKKALVEIHEDLQKVNRSAAKSLQEGLEETLTLHRLGLFQTFGRSFKTTNCIESLNSGLKKYIGRVTNWSSSDMRYRWISCALMDLENRLYKVCHHKKLPQMKAALKREVLAKKAQRIS